MTTKIYWLDAAQGRVTIGTTTVLIGRSPDCTIVLEGPQISRYHAVVRLGESGAELLPMGREAVRVNGVERRSLTALRAGDLIEMCGWSFRVGEGETFGVPDVARVVWFLERQTGLLHYVTGAAYRVGGDERDDLIFVGWEPTVFTLDASAGPPVLTAQRPGVWCDRALDAGERLTLADAARIAYREESLTVRARQVQVEGTTAPASDAQRPVTRAVLEFMPRGGQLTVEIGGKVHTTALSERRCDLVACLLRPPAPFVAGELIPEDLLCSRVWAGEKNGRVELNSLLYRLRQALAEEGIDASALFDRRGGGLRFCLAPGADVTVR